MSVNKFAKEYFMEGTRDAGVLVIHGFTSSPSYMRDLCYELNALGYWVYAPLLPGHGLFEGALADYNEEMWFNSVISATRELKAKGISKVFVFGHSLGGIMALRLGELGLVDGVISLAAPVKLQREWKAKLFAYAGRHIFHRLSKPDGLDNMYRYFRTDGMSIRHLLNAIKTVKYELFKMDKPLLIISTDSDDTVDNRSAHIIYDEVSSKVKDMLKIQGSHHMCVMDSIKQYINSVSKFIEENS